MSAGRNPFILALKFLAFLLRIDSLIFNDFDDSRDDLSIKKNRINIFSIINL